MPFIAYILLTFGGFLCILNFYFSFLRNAVYKIQGKESEYPWVSGIPLFGSGFVIIVLILLQEPIGLFRTGVVLVAIDTGGLHWLVGTMLFMTVRELLTWNLEAD